MMWLLSPKYTLKPKYLNIVIQKILRGENKLTDETDGYQKIFNSSIIEDPLARYSIKSKDGILSPIVKSLDEYNSNETIEDLVVRLFKPYYGYSENQLLKELNLEKSNAKSKYYNLAKAILKVDGEKIEEFEKADIQMKTIILQASGTLKESMSFPQIQFQQIVNEDWEESEFFEQITKRFFFVIFQKQPKGEPRLKKVMFWNAPWKDLEIIEKVWLDTQDKIKNGQFNNFIKISDKMTAHVRPKATNSRDLMQTHLGTHEKKKCFWLNREYILNAVK